MLEEAKSQEEKETVLKIVRDELSLTQQQLADFLGIHRTTIVRCEKSKSELSLTFKQFQAFSKLIYDRLGVVVLLQLLIGASFDLTDEDADVVKEILNFEKKKHD